jgi:uncharacterized protein
MSRIRKAYQVRFRTLLQAARARRLEQGVHWLVEAAQRLSAEQDMPSVEAFHRVYESLASKPPFRRLAARPPPARFWCDAGLGGLARWLRAAGYEAFWRPDISDDELLQEAQRAGATILTTDSMLMERRILRDRLIPALWLAPALGIPGQLAQVFREFGLTAGPPRCMSCGGELQRADKEALQERIPPRTYRWLNEFFVCRQCGKLLWHGSHWLKIQEQLRRLSAGT